MKLTLQTQLFPDPEQARSLAETTRAFNKAADWLAAEAFQLQSSNKIALQKLYYKQLRERFGLSAQMAVRCIAQVCEAYSRDRSIRCRFRPYASIPYGQRLMSFKGDDRVSLLTLEGRIIVPLVMGQYQRERFHLKPGQCDLLRRRDGRWFLLVTVDLPDRDSTPTSDFIGVDFGLVNLATDSDGESFSGEGVENVRQRYAARRSTLQRAAEKRKARGRRPKNVRRKLKTLGNREQRFPRNENHVISKTLVAEATGSQRSIALENLKGIGGGKRFRPQQRARMSGWAFHQLRAFIEYKAAIAGIPVVSVDPRYTSQMCSRCAHAEKANRRSQSEFHCRLCALECNADYNAALNIRARALVNAPMVPESTVIGTVRVQAQAPPTAAPTA